MQRKKFSYTVVGNASWYSYYRKQYGGSQKLKIELLYDAAIPFLSIYPGKTLN